MLCFCLMFNKIGKYMSHDKVLIRNKIDKRDTQHIDDKRKGTESVKSRVRN
jgi:hypothetical protein